MDKDRFRQDLGGFIDAYQEVAKRLGLIPDSGIMDGDDIDEQIVSSLGEIENKMAKEKNLRKLNKSATKKPKSV
jgi:phosphoribosylaminoimidazole-succinocarboxamide synthase